MPQLTKKALIEALEGVSDDTIVVMSEDAEGNRFSPLDCVETDLKYVARSTGSGNIHRKEDRIDGVPCVVLWPRN